jgi:two-component system chemotaxis response regulator CheY
MFDLKTRILIVDDMMTMRKLVIKSCKDLGFSDFTEAADGKLAWEAITHANPPIGLIISDWNMPNCSGVDLLKSVRADSRTKHIPFIMVTAESEKAQVIEAVQAGVTNYVVKPFTTDHLKEKLEAAHKKMAGG